MTMTDDEKQKQIRKWRRRMAWAGIALGLLCRSLPEEYQTPCQVVADFCSGNLF